MTISEIRSAAPFDQLAARFAGAIVTAADPDWDTARSAWNLAVDQRPEAVVVPQSAADVIAVVLFAREHGLRVAAQGTGHAAGALGDLAGSILVHTSALCDLEVDADARRVRAGAGVIWNQVAVALAEHALVGLAGSAGDVGVVGYSLGGGYSWLGREHGLASSWVTAVDLVTGDGEFRRVAAQTDPDLFWALRGGGGNFGVVTALEFEVFPIADVYAGMMLFPLEMAGDVLTTFERKTRELDERATLCARLLHLPPKPDLPDLLRGKAFAAIDGAVNATDAEAEAMLAPFTALGPVMSTFGRIPATALVPIHLDPPMPVPGYDDGVILDDLPPGAIDALLDAAGPGVQTPLLLIDLRLLGGALGRPDPRGGAIDRFEGRFLLNAVGVAPSREAVTAVSHAVNKVITDLEPWRAERDYSNFCETVVRPDTFYTDDVLARLRDVKKRYDPAGVIRAAHELT